MPISPLHNVLRMAYSSSNLEIWESNESSKFTFLLMKVRFFSEKKFFIFFLGFIFVKEEEDIDERSDRFFISVKSSLENSLISKFSLSLME